MVVALGAPSATLAVSETAAEEITPELVEATTQAWVDALWSYYATGQPDLTGLATSEGLADLRAYDPRFRAVEAGDLRFLEEPTLVAVAGSALGDPPEEVDGEQVTFEATMTVDVAPYAETHPAGDDRISELVTGRQRRVAQLQFRREPGSDAWLLDGTGPPADPDYVVGLPEPAPERPCPGLGQRRGGDPLLRRPWCTADGDGRVLVDGEGAAAPEIIVEREPCGPGTRSAYFMYLGSPPGAPIGFWESGDFVRDPRGVLPGTEGYRRSIRLPRDAISTGITNGPVTLWTSESLGPDALIVQVGRRFELWPSSEVGCGGPA